MVGTKVTTPKIVLGSSLREDVFRDIIIDNNFFYDTQRYVSNYQACGKLSGNKDW
jgi:hypothetical protein